MILQETEKNQGKPMSKRTIGLVVLSVFVVSVLLSLFACEKAPKPLAFSIALAEQPDNALNFIALEKGFFKEQGLDVSSQKFPSGKRALEEGFLKGGFDMVTMTEVPFVFAVENHPDLRIFGHTYGADNVNRIVTRQDVGFNSIEQIRGKVIGTQKGSAVHYFFHRVYNSFDIPRSSFTLKFYKAEDLPKALAKGEIDAFSMREPYVSQAEKLMNGQVNIFSMPGVYHQYGVLVASEKVLAEREEAFRRYLKALQQARNFAIHNSQETIEIVGRHLQTSIQEMRSLWRTSNLQLGLHQGLINTIENEIIWRNFLTGLGLDNFYVDLNEFDMSDYIYINVMEDVNPHAVMVVYERNKKPE